MWRLWSEAGLVLKAIDIFYFSAINIQGKVLKNLAMHGT